MISKLSNKDFIIPLFLYCGHVTMIKRSSVMSNAVVLKLYWDSDSLFILISDHLI